MNKEPKLVSLTGWQKDVVAIIDSHATLRESQEYQAMPDYVINKELSLSVAFPRQSGHTTFANYLASKYASIVVYRDIKHYLALSQPLQLHQNTDMLSMFEISYVLTESVQPSLNVEDLKQRFHGKKVVVVDGGESLPARVRSFLLEVATCQVVFLGK
jgi:hypothetical protein